MDGGDILYILVLIFFIISGIIKKAMPKKKENKTSTTAAPVFASEVEEDFDNWYNASHDSQKVIAPEIPKDYFTSSASEQRLYNTPKKETVKPTVSKNVKISDESKNKIEIELDTVEEARKAFIYSEIFQRKY